jgi:hypothetical protein
VENNGTRMNALNMEEMGELATSFFKDLYKVYTNVQPEIIVNIIEPQINQLGFADIWIKWVMVCVKSVI